MTDTTLLTDSRWKKSRQIVKRVVISGELVLETPAHLGNGDQEGLVDMSLLRDQRDGEALLTGTSIAGALRTYLRARVAGYRTKVARDSMTDVLFGPAIGPGDDGEQSYLITHDSLGGAPATELRDGVAIDPKTRTAEDKMKYDLELLQAGTTFPLRFELLIPADEERAQQVRQGLAVALEGFEKGEILLGARKRRGFGECRVQQWTVQEYDLTDPGELVAWLTGAKGSSSERLESEEVTSTLDKREMFTLEATFALDSSLLIRAQETDPAAPDMVHLKSNRNGRQAPILSGTSLAGALRARGLRIANTVGKETDAKKMIENLFGPRKIDSKPGSAWASRIAVKETEVRNPLEKVLTRIKMDRFTGGTLPTALFNQQPLFGGIDTEVDVALSVQSPSEADVGLLLLLLKDLWTKDLPLGGEASVGRGRLAGKSVDLTWRKAHGREETWRMEKKVGGGLVIKSEMIEGEPKERLQKCVDAFVKEVGGEPAKKQ